MLNVRKYRATTTRDALELVKKDLGEDAFVLETKRVSTGGFLGFNSRTEIEVSAATGSDLAGDAASASISVPASKSTIDLRDDADAAPDFSNPPVDIKEMGMMPALATRAAAADVYEKTGNNLLGTVEPSTVEISPEAPRFVFPKQNADHLAFVLLPVGRLQLPHPV